MHTTRYRTLLRQSVAALVIGWFVFLPATPAFAHGEGESKESRVLALDALAYLANRPAHYVDSAMEKLNDAIAAKDTTGVNMDKLTEAMHEMSAGQMMQARTALQDAIQPLSGQTFSGQMFSNHMANGQMISGHSMGEEPGTTLMLDPLKGSTNWGDSSWLLAGASALAVLAGLLLARRWRPPESLLEIRSHLTGLEA